MEEVDDIITVDFKALVNVLWSNKWLIIGITTLFVLGGAFYAFTAREEFVSEGKILPEMTSGNSNNLSGLAGLAALGGINLGSVSNGSDAVRPDLYPDVINSTPFFLSLLVQKFESKNADSLVFEDYFHHIIEENKEHKQIKVELFKSRPIGVLVLNRLTEDRIKELRNRISATYDNKSGVILISVEMPDPAIAAQIAQFTMEYLTSYITDYRTKKLKLEVDFLRSKVATARVELYKDQTKKASYADQYSAPTIRLQSADIQRERLESDYKMSSSVYNELLKKYEESKIKLQQETPIFQILDPPIASMQKSSPKRLFIIIICFFIGFVISTGIVFFINIKKFI